MGKWEYCKVIGGAVHYFTIDGRKSVQITVEKAIGDKDLGDATDRCIARLGIEGWELFSTEHGWIFKRPLKE